MQINEILKHNKVILLGSETIYKNIIISKFQQEYPNNKVMYGSDTSMQELKSVIYGLLYTPDVLIVKECNKLESLDIFSKASCRIVLDSESLNRSKELDKLKLESLVLEFESPKPWELEKYVYKFIENRAIELGLTLEPLCKVYMYKQFGNDLCKINSELEKLVLANIKSVTLADIKNSCPKGLYYNIFDLVEHVLNKNIAVALDLLNKIEQNNETFKLISILFNQLEILLYLKTTRNSLGDASNHLGTALPILKKLQIFSDKIDDNLIIRNMLRLSEIDSNIRKGSFSAVLQLENFIISFWGDYAADIFKDKKCN